MTEPALLLIVLIPIALLALYRWFYRPSFRHCVSEIRKQSDKTYILRFDTLKLIRGRMTECTYIDYRGSGTVFHEAKTGTRASTEREWILSNALTMYKWGKDDDRKPAA